MAEERHHGFLPPRAPDTPEDGPAPERPPRLSVGASGPGSREGENRAGQENFKRMREEQASHQIEREGKELRSMMDWIDTEFHAG